METIEGLATVRGGHHEVRHCKFKFIYYFLFQAASGHMWGTFKMERKDMSTFECRIPAFSLESKIDDGDDDNNDIIGN